MEKSRFVRYDPSVHEVMQRLMSELTQRSNRGQPLVPTSLRRSELQYDLYIPRYEKNEDDFVPAEYPNEYSSVVETRLRNLQLEVGSASMPRSENKRKRVTPKKRCLKDS